jgi:hypothetical protein
MTTADAQWLVATVIVGLCAGAAVFGAVTERSWLSLPSLVPVAAGLFIRTSGPEITLPGHSWIVALSMAMVALAVVSGGPLVSCGHRLDAVLITSTRDDAGDVVVVVPLADRDGVFQ